MFNRRIIVATTFLGLGALGTAAAHDAAQDEAARVPLEAYIQGHRSGDASFMEKAFHPTARMTYMADTGLVVVPISEYIGGMRSRGARATADTFPRRITMLDAAGNTAVARIDMQLATATFVDYMTVHKFADGWKIVNKSFHRTAAR